MRAGSPEAEAALDDVGLCLGMLDVSDAFHRLRIPLGLSCYFGLPPLSASELGMVGQLFQGQISIPLDMLAPVAGSLPNGVFLVAVLLSAVDRAPFPADSPV